MSSYVIIDAAEIDIILDRLRKLEETNKLLREEALAQYNDIQYLKHQQTKIKKFTMLIYESLPCMCFEKKLNQLPGGNHD